MVTTIVAIGSSNEQHTMKDTLLPDPLHKLPYVPGVYVLCVSMLV